MKNITSQLKMFAMTCLVASSLTACGSDSATTVTSTTTTINGQAIAGAVDGTVVVTEASGTEVARATVTNGMFSITIDNTSLSKSLDFEVTGDYRDEVSGLPVTLTSANPLALRVAAGYYQAGQLGNAPVTPSSSVIRAMVINGKTLANAETKFAAAFGYTPDMTAQPFDPYTTTTIDDTATENNAAAFRVGVMSQLGANLSLDAADLATLPVLLADDLADGNFDGVSATGNPVTFLSTGANLQTLHQEQALGIKYSIAVSNFAGNRTANPARITAPNTGRPPIIADAPGTTKIITLSNGREISVKIDIPSTAPFQMGYRDVKTTHNITLTDVITTLPIDLYSDADVNDIVLKPWMYMYSIGMQHGSEMGIVNKPLPATGIYTVNVYYRMATAMGGQWTLDVSLNEKVGGLATTTFYPNVMMNAMNGNTDFLLGTVSNDAMKWTNMNGTVNREFRVYLNDATSTDLTVFIATQTMEMVAPMVMKPAFPAVRGGLGNPQITSVAVDLYADTGAGYQWQASMTEGLTVDTYGQYNVTGLTLDTVNQNNLQIHLTVDGYSMVDKAGTSAQLKFIALP